jgi:hypothetical protein
MRTPGTIAKSGAPFVEDLSMNGRLLPADMKSIDGSFADLLSVDADAHLQKLAACMFPTPAQLPVELVRAALKRGAAAIDLQVRNRCLIISDNGSGIGDSQWLSLACALDSSRGAADRENAIASLQSEASPGIGLLAVSKPGHQDRKCRQRRQKDHAYRSRACAATGFVPLGLGHPHHDLPQPGPGGSGNKTAP